MKKKWKILIWILIIILIILAILVVIRANTTREIDDITPGIACEQEYLQKADILWVIPRYQNTPISENEKWCSEILVLNKTIGMHGIYHAYKEFNYYVNKTEFQETIQIFEDCFGYKPTIFKPPYLVISDENEILVKKHGFKIRNRWHQTFHKVYHCNNTGTLPNWFHDIF